MYTELRGHLCQDTSEVFEGKKIVSLVVSKVEMNRVSKWQKYV